MKQTPARSATRRKTKNPHAGRIGIRAKVWLTLGDGTRFCQGKVDLLEAVDRLGSLRSAAQSMEMSYRHAWGMLRDLDRAAGFPFLERSSEGAGPRLRLTAAGRRFIDEYHRLTAPLDKLVETRFRRSFRP